MPTHQTHPTLHDTKRLDRLHALDILDSTTEDEYDEVAQLGAALLRSPVAAVNFVDEERHFTKAIVGAPGAAGSSVPNTLSFCASTVTEPSGVLVVPDTAADERWYEHPLVTGGPQLGFYVGVSLHSGDERVGVLCCFGPEERTITDVEVTQLRTLARHVEGQLELRRQNAELRRLAITDPLTGLPNRTLLTDRLERALVAGGRTGASTGVLFLDVDDFKRVNDRHGHEVGDRVLSDIGEHLAGAVRSSDTAARVAGDEFVVLCPGADVDELDLIAARIGAPTRPALPDGSAAPGLSIGAVVALPGDSPVELLRLADEAMYRDKRRRGRLHEAGEAQPA